LIAWLVFSGGLYFRAFGRSITQTVSSYLMKPSANSLANGFSNRSMLHPRSAAIYGFGRRNNPSVVRCGHVSKYNARRRVSSSQRIVFASVQKRLDTRWYLKSDKARQPPTAYQKSTSSSSHSSPNSPPLSAASACCCSFGQSRKRTLSATTSVTHRLLPSRAV